jgi:hypothetical protein
MTLEPLTGKDREKRRLDVIIAVDAKVRMPATQEFDEKGKPKPFKKDPNDKDSKLGGVKGAIDDLREKQTAWVTLGKTSKKNSKYVATIIVIDAEAKK